MIDVPATGRCQCGQLGYAVSAQPFVEYTCHCRECQRLSSSAFATRMQVPAEAVDITAGVAHTRTRPTDSGSELCIWLCASCGSVVFLQNSARPRVRTVLVGTLEHPEQVQVNAHIWLKGGDGSIELAEAVVQACEEESNFKHLYELEAPLSERIELITKEVYGGDGVTYTDDAKAKLDMYEADPAAAELGTCMVKTHLSLSHDPDLKGAPKGWELPISDILVYKGAGFLVPVAGAIKLMPGTCSNPAFRNIDVDVDTGKVKGLF